MDNLKPDVMAGHMLNQDFLFICALEHSWLIRANSRSLAPSLSLIALFFLLLFLTQCDRTFFD